MTYTVTLGAPPELDAEARRQRALRARAALDAAGWLFDEQISDLTRDLLGTTPGQTEVREAIFQQIDATAQVKGRLLKILEIQEAEIKAHERRNRRHQPADAQ